MLREVGRAIGRYDVPLVGYLLDEQCSADGTKDIERRPRFADNLTEASQRLGNRP